LSIISTLQYQNAIPLPDRDNGGATLFVATGLILTVFCIFLSILVYFFGSQIIAITGLQLDGRVLVLLPVVIAFASLNACFQFWSLRKKEYTKLAIVKGAQSIAMAIGQISFGVIGLGAAGLIFGHLFGQAVAVFYLAVDTVKRYHGHFRDVSQSSLKNSLHSQRSFATVFTPSALLGAGSVYMPAILLGILYGPAIAGIFAFCLQISKAAILIVVQSIARVYMVDSIENFNNKNFDNIRRTGARYALSQLIIGAPIFLVLGLFGERIFEIVFGDNWSIAGTYLGLLIPHLLTLFVLDHLVVLFVVVSNHGAKLVWDALKFGVLVLVTFVADGLQLEPKATIFILSCSWGLVHMLLIPLTLFSLRRALRNGVD